MKNYKEYKETTPENTINFIRSILNDLGLLLLDSNANRDNIFACRVILGNHNLTKLGIGMNGKGSTFEYALASGYAEFMEKIQNRFLCDYMHSYYGTKEFIKNLPSNSRYKEKLHQENVILDFRYDEREEYWPLEKVLTSFGNELMLLYHADNIEELKSILIDVIKIEENHILMIPCFSQKDNDEVFIPIDLILHAIGSNGMTAGNSEKEALLHGFCEIFERYALKNIYYGELTPPTIPIEEFSETPVYEKIKYLIEKNYPKKNTYILCTSSFSFLKALFIWFLTVLTDIFISSAISSYFIPSLFASKNTSLHFTGNESMRVHIRASSKERSSHSSSEIISSRSEGRILLPISVSLLSLSIHRFLTIV